VPLPTSAPVSPYVESHLTGREGYSIWTAETINHCTDTAIFGIEAIDLIRQNGRWPDAVLRAIDQVSEPYAPIPGYGDIIRRIDWQLTVPGDRIRGIVGRQGIEGEDTSGRVVGKIALAKVDMVIVCYCFAV
jgi:hypothetical protein